jgi:hypothetical protein
MSTTTRKTVKYMTPDRELLDALESLQGHPGWRYVVERTRAEWVLREREGRRQALNDTDDKRALDKLRQITAAQEAVEWVLAWPEREAQRLSLQVPAPPPESEQRVAHQHIVSLGSRRGSL